MNGGKLLAPLLGLSRPVKRSIQVLVDVFLLTLSFCVAMSLRLESVAFLNDPRIWLGIALVLPPTIGLFVVMGFYRAVVRFVSFAALRTVLIGIVASAMMLFAVDQLLELPIPRSVPPIYMLFATSLVGGVRLMMRAIYAGSHRLSKRLVIVYGAGNSGRQLVAALDRGPEYRAVAFIDDARDLYGAEVAGLRVYAPDRLPWLVEKHQASALLLAMPSLTPGQMREVLEKLKDLPIQVRTVPGSADIVSGRAKMSDLREVQIEDLLERDTVDPDPDLMRATIAGRSVMVTGAGGSIGSELCRQIMSADPSVLVLFEQSEFGLYAIHQQIAEIAKRSGTACQIVPILGSVRDGLRLRELIATYRVQTIYHAAAYKHVPMVEMNIIEGIRNNLFGTQTAALAAAEMGVSSFILVSTDKAVRPTNIMGASKRMAELVCQALAHEYPRTVFSMVRFGNVLGSSGSVIPSFRRQIAEGGPITITHPDITRYFMTIPEAAQLVIQAAAMAKGGDVFLLDMGEPVRIVDLAVRMAHLHGLRPIVFQPGSRASVTGDGDIAVIFDKLRPGEKLYEELLIGADAQSTQHSRIMTAREFHYPWAEISTFVSQLDSACISGDVSEIRRILRAAGTSYVPQYEIVDLVWSERDALLEDAPRPSATP